MLRKLVFDNTDNGTDLIDVPVLVVLDPTVIDRAALTKSITNLAFYDPERIEICRSRSITAIPIASSRSRSWSLRSIAAPRPTTSR